jgi:hypothetical protein
MFSPANVSFGPVVKPIASKWLTMRSFAFVSDVPESETKIVVIGSISSSKFETLQPASYEYSPPFVSQYDGTAVGTGVGGGVGVNVGVGNAVGQP